MNRFIRVFVPVTALASIAGMLTGCGGTHETTAAQASAGRPIPVAVVSAEAVELANVYEAPGTVRARTASVLASKLMGYVRDVKVQPGDRVAAGQLLVSIDSRDLESAWLQARAAEQEAMSGIAEADSGIAVAKTQLGLAKITFDRMEGLFAKKSISNQEFDEAQARLRTAEAAHQMAISKRSQLDARIAQAKQGVGSAAILRSYAEIRAPFAGVVTDKRAEPGQMATPGAPLLTVEQVGAYRLEAPVEESMLGSVKIGQPVTVVLDSSSGPVSGTVNEIVPAIDPSSRALLVKVTLPPGAMVRSGSFGRLRLPRGSRQAVVVPAGAIAHRGDIQTVFVAENGVARIRMITASDARDGQAEVLSGVQSGERIVYPRPAILADGSVIEVRR
jgi:RND family efflux transporter MFP subunit